jgi:hypothetical protein
MAEDTENTFYDKKSYVLIVSGVVIFSLLFITALTLSIISYLKSTQKQPQASPGLPGSQGPQGPSGSQGIAGTPGSPGQKGTNNVIASARVLSTGNPKATQGLAVTRSAVGVYDYTFLSPQSNDNYTVSSQIFYGPPLTTTDTNVFITNTLVTGFTLEIGIGDNSTTPDIKTDAEHCVTVMEINSS